MDRALHGMVAAMKEIIGEAEVVRPGVVSYMVRAEADGVTGDTRGTISLSEFLAAGWNLSKPLENPGDSADILTS